MELQVLGALLSLTENITEETVSAAIKALQAKPEELEAKLKELEAKLATAGTSDGATQETVAKLQKEVVELKSSSAARAATELVDAAIRSGKFVPAVRNELVQMALSNGAAFGTMAKNTPDNAVFTAGAKGSAGNETFELAPYELTPEEETLRRQTGLTREEVVLQKLEDAGVTPPATVLATLKETDKKE